MFNGELESLLLGFSLVFTVGIVAYMFYRERMTGSGIVDYVAGLFPRYYHRFKLQILHRDQDFSNKRIVKLMGVNLLGNIAISIFCVSIVMHLQPQEDVLTWLLVGLMVVLICLTFYGMGMYLTSIVIEAFTKVQLHRVYSFRIQFRSTSLFHGPISHLLIVSGWMAVLAVLGLLDLWRGRLVMVHSPTLVVLGGWLFASVMGVSQVVNKTARVQIPPALVIFLIYFGAIIIWPNDVRGHAMALFSGSALFFYNLILNSFLVLSGWKKKN